MSKAENLKIVEHQLDTAMKMARIIVEDGDMKKDDMAQFLADKANEAFIRVFDASDDQFAVMLLEDIMHSLPRILNKFKGDDSDEV